MTWQLSHTGSHMTRRQQHISHIKTYQLFLTCIGSSPARGYEGVVGLPLRLKWNLGWDPAPPPSGRRVPQYPHHLCCLRHPKRPSPQGGQSTHARMHECVHGIGLSQLKFQTCYPTVQDHKSHTQINTYATHNQSIIFPHTCTHAYTPPPPSSFPLPLPPPSPLPSLSSLTHTDTCTHSDVVHRGNDCSGRGVSSGHCMHCHIHSCLSSVTKFTLNRQLQSIDTSFQL